MSCSTRRKSGQGMVSGSLARRLAAGCWLAGCLGAAVFVPGAMAQPESVVLTGGSYVRVDSAASVTPQQFTLETWFRPDGPGYGFANDGFGAALVNKPGEGLVGESLTSWGLFWSSGTQKLFAHITHQLFSSGSYMQSNAVIPMGTLAHATMTFDGTTLKLYINGQLDNSMVTVSSNVYYAPNMPVLIGASNFGAGYSRTFQGLLDEVRLWDRALTSAEVAALDTCEPAGAQPNLLAGWNFDGGSLADISGHGYGATTPGGYTLAYEAQSAAIHQAPVLANSPANVTLCGSGTAVFTVTTVGGHSPVCQWQVLDGGAWVNLTDGNGVAVGPSYSGNVHGTGTKQLTVGPLTRLRPHPNVVQFRCVLSNACGGVTSDAAGLTMNSADFNGDGDVGTDQDIEAFFACLAGTCCPACGSADFNGDGDVGTDGDIEAFFRVLAGGGC